MIRGLKLYLFTIVLFVCEKVYSQEIEYIKVQNFKESYWKKINSKRKREVIEITKIKGENYITKRTIYSEKCVFRSDSTKGYIEVDSVVKSKSKPINFDEIIKIIKYLESEDSIYNQKTYDKDLNNKTDLRHNFKFNKQYVPFEEFKLIFENLSKKEILTSLTHTYDPFDHNEITLEEELLFQVLNNYNLIDFYKFCIKPNNEFELGVTDATNVLIIEIATNKNRFIFNQNFLTKHVQQSYMNKNNQLISLFYCPLLNYYLDSLIPKKSILKPYFNRSLLLGNYVRWLAHQNKKEIFCKYPDKFLVTDSNVQFFHFDNDKSIVLSCKNPIVDTVYSEFTLNVCSSDTIIDTWKSFKKTAINFNDNSLTLNHWMNLPIGGNFEMYNRVVFNESFFFKDDTLIRAFSLDSNFKKYDENQIQRVLNLYNSKKEISTVEIKLLYNQLFVAAISGSKQALTYFNEIRFQLNSSNDLVYEDYEGLSKKLKLLKIN